MCYLIVSCDFNRTNNYMRKIPDDNLAYPTLLNWDTGSSGSGFRMRVETVTYFITAKHVLFDENGNLRGDNLTLLSQTGDVNDDSTFLISVDIKKLESNGMLFKHSKYDIAAFVEAIHKLEEDNTYKSASVDGVEFVKTGNGKMISVNYKTGVALINTVLISNDVFICGYPSSLGMKQSPQFDYNQPLLRKGIVANINKTSGTIILDCPVYPGNSGGPVIQVDQIENNKFHYTIIGVVSEFIPYSQHWRNLSNNIMHTEIFNSGYSVAVAMDYVFEMLNIDKNHS